jgi:hypothetical protein
MDKVKSRLAVATPTSANLSTNERHTFPARFPVRQSRYGEINTG